MNYLILSCGIVGMILSVDGQLLDHHSAVRERCEKNQGLGKGDLAASGSSTFLYNPKSKCYLECFLDGLGLFKTDNSLDAVRSVELIDEDIREHARPLINKCIKDNEGIADRCEKSFASVKCLYEANPGIFQQLGILEPPKKD